MKGLRDAIKWIAENDEPAAMDVDDVEGFVSVVLVAHLSGRTPRQVAERVMKVRLQQMATAIDRAEVADIECADPESRHYEAGYAYAAGYPD